MVFSLPMSQLNTAIQDTISSLGPVWLVAAGMTLGMGILTWGMRMFRWPLR